MTKHEVKDAHMDAAGLSPEERAALVVEEEGDGTDKELDTKSDAKTDGDGAAADSKSDVLPQTTDDKKAGAVADQKTGDKKVDDKKVDDKKTDDKKVDAATGDVKPGDDKDDGAAAKADASGDQDDAAKAAKPSEDDKDASTAPPPVGVDSFRAQLAARGIPEDYEDQLKAVNADIETLDATLAEGEIDYAAHAKQNRELTTKLAELVAVKREAEFVAGNNEVMADQHWNWEVERFVEENEEFKNPVVYGALRGGLEDLYADEENSGKSYRWFLREAAGKVREAFNMDAEKIPVEEGKKDEEVKRTEQIKKEHDDKPQDPPPKTLADVPAAASEEEATDEFAQIDKLEGMDQEAALAKMSKAKADQYLDSRNF